MKSIGISFIILVSLFLSCTNDENINDGLDAVLGTYTYTEKQYLKNQDNTLTWQPEFYQKQGQGVIKRSSNGLELIDGGVILVKTQALVIVDYGFYFDVEDQPVKVDGLIFEARGFDQLSSEGIRYHGKYSKLTKSFSGFYEYRGMLTGTDGTSREATFVLAVDAVKSN